MAKPVILRGLTEVCGCGCAVWPAFWGGDGGDVDGGVPDGGGAGRAGYLGWRLWRGGGARREHEMVRLDTMKSEELV